MWIDVSSSAPHLVHKGLQLSPIKCRCLVRVLCPVRRPVTILGCVLLKDSSLVLIAGLGPQNHLSSLSLSTDKNPPHYHMLVIYPELYLFCYILPRNPQDQFLSNKVVNNSVSCKLVSNFISSYPRMSRDPQQPHRMLGGNVINCLLALLYQWGHCSYGLKDFKSCLIVRANTNILL